MFKFNVYLNDKFIDSVFYSITAKETVAEACESVRSSLINHDGYNAAIKVVWPKGQRITEMVYELQGNYGCGWEYLCSEYTRKEVRKQLKAYRENEGGNYRIVSKRERK